MVKELPEEDAEDKETGNEREKKQVGFLQAAKCLLQNKYYIIILFIYLTNYFMSGVSSSVSIYFVTYILKAPGMLGTLNALIAEASIYTFKTKGGHLDGTQTERDAICQAQLEGWNKETIGSHTVRRCNIHDCEQTGIVGHLGGVFSIIEDNHIHHINNKQQLAGAEIGGIKMHAAIDVIFRRNHIHHCTRGLWLDWQAQGTRVTQNLFHDNTPPEGVEPSYLMFSTEDLFIEVSHGPTLVDNNVFLSPVSGRLAAQGIAYVHNLICGVFTCVGEAFEPEQKFENPDGTPILFDRDYFGDRRGVSPLPGPFAGKFNLSGRALIEY